MTGKPKALAYAEDTRLAWAAGLFEGEGCISLDKRFDQLVLSISMTDKDVVELFAEVIGYGKVRKLHTPSMQAKGRKPAWIWTVTGSPAELCATKLLPYLCERRTERLAETLAIVFLSKKKRRVKK